MRYFLTALMAIALCLPLHAQEVTGSPAFDNLSAALRYTDHGLDSRSWNALNGALFPALQPGEPNRTSWDELTKERGKKRLANIFRHESFPKKEDTFVIGASSQAGSNFIGRSRIKFVKTDDGWHLNAVYVVR
jgi:hypothetical protein